MPHQSWKNKTKQGANGRWERYLLQKSRDASEEKNPGDMFPESDRNFDDSVKQVEERVFLFDSFLIF